MHELVNKWRCRDKTPESKKSGGGMRLCYYRVLREADTFCTVGMRHRLTQGSLYGLRF